MSTALEMTESELRACAIGIVRRGRGISSKGSGSQRMAVIQRARVLAAELRQHFGEVRVVLFGSVVREGRWSDSGSDVDIAVDGLVGEDYWTAWGLAEKTFPDRRVDFVDFKMATSGMKASIENSGLQL